MPDESSVDPYLDRLFEDYSNTEVIELQQYVSEWDRGTYRTVAQSVLDHSQRKGFDPLKYLRKAHNFNTRGAVRVPRTGYRQDGAAVYRKGNEFLIVRPDQYGVEKIVTYGINEE
ncbi:MULTISPECIES: hypothetical protein [unclassified Microcoleus]|uniref:hypothetical protein n=1 Tax=unclassified Microcoleus TaxID=2642155 RepID=UPI002FCF1A19